MGTGIRSGCFCLKEIGHEFDIRESDLLSSEQNCTCEGVRKRRKGRPIATKHTLGTRNLADSPKARAKLEPLRNHDSSLWPSSSQHGNHRNWALATTVTAFAISKLGPIPLKKHHNHFQCPYFHFSFASTSSPTAASMPRFSFSSTPISRPLLTLSVKSCL